jgi:hypothetical protein
MLNITDSNYFLPIVQALAGGDVMSTGTNKPQMIRGLCIQTGEKSDYIVKYLGAERMYPGACAKELLAVCIANQMGFYVPEPVQITVTREFVETLIGNPIYGIANKSIGFNYGSSYLGSFPTFLTGQSFNAKQWEQIPAIFAFDMFIQNADRNNAKPNMISDGEKIYLFDHEMAYGFANEIPNYKTPWIIRDNDMDWVSNHFFFPYLKARGENFDTFADTLEVLNKDFWHKIDIITPIDWKTDEYYKIIEGLQATLAHKGEFIDQIKTRLK